MLKTAQILVTATIFLFVQQAVAEIDTNKSYVESRQARDYNPGGGGMIQGGYGGGVGGGSGGGGGYGNGGGYAMAYPPAHYAIPPIVMGGGYGGGSGGYGGSGGGYDDDMSDYKELIGLLGLKGLKGLKGVKAVKAVKGLGLLALSPFLLPLLLLLPILPLLLLLLPLLLLLLLPVPVITTPAGRRKRSTIDGSYFTQSSIFQETLDDIMTQLPTNLITSSNIKQVDTCLDKFICETGLIISQHAPTFINPSVMLLEYIWPRDLHYKIDIFKKSAARQTSNCLQFKCKIKKLENLFYTLVVRNSNKLKDKISVKLKNSGIADNATPNPFQIIKTIFN